MIKILIVNLLLLFLISSCVKDVDYKLDFEGSKILVYAEGTADKPLHVYLTKTFPPLNEPKNPDSLLIDNAFIEVYENDILIDTLKNVNNYYKSNFNLKQGFSYRLKINIDNKNLLYSKYDTVPYAAAFIDAKVVLTEIDTFEYLSKYYFNTILKIKKSIKYPYNEIYVKFYFENGQKEIYYYLSSKSDLIECDGCFNILNNQCVINLNNDLVILNNKMHLNYSQYKISELDSIKFYLKTYSNIAEKICQAGIDFEEYYNNPLPFASNPSIDFSNIEGGYGLFMLNNVDSLTIKLK